MLEARQLTVGFRRGRNPVTVVDGIDFAVAAGRTTALVGESGSGKSTVALAIMGLTGADAFVRAEQLTLDGVALPETGSSAWTQVRGRRLGMVFQEPMTALNPVLSIGEQIAEGIRHHTGAARGAAWRRAVDWLDRVGIPDPALRARQFAHEFSGGMRQRVVIAMAAALEPRLLIADEPTTAIDVTLQAQILDLLRELQERIGLGLLLISHDLAMVRHVADQVHVLYAGRVVESGPPAVVLNRPAHPYAAALLACRPDPERGAHLPVIPGTMPDPGNWPGGCRFHPRCATGRAVGRTPDTMHPACLEDPVLAAVPGVAGHAVACPLASIAEVSP